MGSHIHVVHFRVGVRSDDATNGHEEAIIAISNRVSRYGRTLDYPKVAPDPAMYWPRVLIMPLGPAPYRKMLTVPGHR